MNLDNINIGLIVAVVIALVILKWFISTSNKLIGLANKVDESKSNIEAACMKRFEAVQNCYATMTQLVSHEQQMIIESCKYRTEMTAKELSELDQNLQKSWTTIKAVAENYPEIKSTAVFTNLQNVIAETEDTLFAQRRIYNSNVTVYNNAIMMFPSSIVAGMKKCVKGDLIEAPTEQLQSFQIPVKPV